MNKSNKTKKQYEIWLNEIGCPDDDHPERGGRCSWAGVYHYGAWLRRNDPIAFEVGFSEWTIRRD